VLLTIATAAGYVPPLVGPPPDLEAPQPSGRSAFASASDGAATERSTEEERHDRVREWCHSQGDAATEGRGAGPSGRPNMELHVNGEGHPWPWIGQVDFIFFECSGRSLS